MKSTKIVKIQNSSCVSRVAYNTKSRSLTVMFNNGSVYMYAGVPATVANDFASAESKGTFFSNNIRDQYESQKAG